MRTACVLSAIVSMSVCAAPAPPAPPAPATPPVPTLHSRIASGPFTRHADSLTITRPAAIADRETFHDDAVSIALRSVDLDAIFQRADQRTLLLTGATPAHHWFLDLAISAALER